MRLPQSSTQALWNREQHEERFNFNEKERKIFSIVVRNQGISQGELCKITGFPQQTTSRVIKKLIDRGTIRSGSRITSGRRGQQPIKLELADDFAYTFGISIMTDAVYVALMNFSGQPLEEKHVALASMGQDEVLNKIKQLIEELTKKHIKNPAAIFAAGVCIGGYFIDEGNIVNPPPSLDHWALIDIEQIIADSLVLPTYLENDGNAAAIAESLVGVGKRVYNFVYLFIAAGFGGGVISNGELLRGVNGNAGELGLLLPKTLYPHPNLELLRHTLAGHGINLASVSEMIDQFDPNWPGIEDWVTRVRDSINLVASASAALLDCEAIVIGGRIPTRLAEKLIPHISIPNNARRSHSKPVPKIMLAELGSDGSAIGAAAIPFMNHFFAV